MRIVLFGPPGAGKGTIAQFLKEKYKLEHISTGDLLRLEMKGNTDLGKEIKGYVERGDLVPDEVVTKMIKSRITKPEIIKKGYMLDGFPRTVTQAEDLDKILESVHTPLDYAIFLEATLSVVIQRLTGRLVCKECAALYHATNKPPKKSGICDSCGGALYQRNDDKEETIRARMDVYLKNSEPVIKYYAERNNLKKIDADKGSPEVETRLMKMFQDDGKIHHNQDRSRARAA